MQQLPQLEKAARRGRAGYTDRQPPPGAYGRAG